MEDLVGKAREKKGRDSPRKALQTFWLKTVRVFAVDQGAMQTAHLSLNLLQVRS